MKTNTFVPSFKTIFKCNKAMNINFSDKHKKFQISYKKRFFNIGQFWSQRSYIS